MAVAALAAGCGASHRAIVSPNLSRTARLTAAVYRAEAHNVCTAAKRAAAAVPPPKSKQWSVTINDWKAFITIEETEIAALERLTPPASLAQLVASGLAAKKAQVGVMESALAKAQTGTPLLQAAFLLAKSPDDSHTWAKTGVAVCQY